MENNNTNNDHVKIVFETDQKALITEYALKLHPGSIDPTEGVENATPDLYVGKFKKPFHLEYVSGEFSGVKVKLKKVTLDDTENKLDVEYSLMEVPEGIESSIDDFNNVLTNDVASMARKWKQDKEFEKNEE